MIKEKERAALATAFNEARPLSILVITMSDRASEGSYEDRSGPLVCEHLENLFRDSGVPIAIEPVVLSDDADVLRTRLESAVAVGTDLIVTTGGTGVGPRDITTDVVLDLADKTIPGVMEAVRMKYSLDKPCAQLSRTVAAIIGDTLLYAIPGSTKGVEEYMTEIVKSLPHTLCVMRGLDTHG